MQIAILGCGTVAGGVIRLLTQNADELEQQLGEAITIRKVLARTPQKALDLGIAQDKIVDNIDAILSDDEVDVVVELMGGITDAYDYVRRALIAGKHVVTANKDLIAMHFRDLLGLAAKSDVRLAFEASVGGGIPLIAPLHRTLALNGVNRIYGILNGTTNFILTHMTQYGVSYEDALRLAREKGYAEANPSADIEGDDAARKIAILSTLSFHTQVTYGDVAHEGISSITQTDIRFAARSGYVIKLLAAARKKDHTVEVFVRPAMIPMSHPLASVNDVYNAVFIKGEAVGNVMLYGQGAGALPTANSVIGDLTDIMRQPHAKYTYAPEGIVFDTATIGDTGAIESVYYARLLVSDRPNVLAGIASVFGGYGISMASLIQEPRDDGKAELMLLTHMASEKAMRRAMSELIAFDYVDSGYYIMCMEQGDED